MPCSFDPPRKPGRPEYPREINGPWAAVMRRMHKAGWTDGEMAEGRLEGAEGEVEAEGLPGDGWTRRAVAYWRRKLGLKINKRRKEKGLRDIHEIRLFKRRARSGLWLRFLPAGERLFSDREIEILNILDDDPCPGRRPALTRRELAARIRVKVKGKDQPQPLPPSSWVVSTDPRYALGRLLSLGLVQKTTRPMPLNNFVNVYSLSDHVHRREYVPRPTSVEQNQRRLGFR